jgi:hypothetical protein
VGHLRPVAGGEAPCQAQIRWGVFPPRPCFSPSGWLRSFPDRFFGFQAAFWFPGPFFSCPGGHLLSGRPSWLPAAFFASRAAILLPETPSSFRSAYLSPQSLILTSKTVILALPNPPAKTQLRVSPRELEIVRDPFEQTQVDPLRVGRLAEQQHSSWPATLYSALLLYSRSSQECQALALAVKQFQA